jgi:hypothetical protein
MSDSSQQTKAPREGTADYYAQRAAINMARARAAGGEDESESDAVAHDVLQREAEEAGREIGYAARLLVQATLPHSKPAAGVNEFERSNGFITLKITADSACGLPYGTYPRLILAWLTTEAVRTKSPDIELGDSLSEFMGKLDLSPRGGARGNITRLREHMRRLFSSTVSATCQREGEWQRLAFNPVEKVSMFWDSQRPEQIAIWRSAIRLNQTFFEEITRKPVPVDMHALQVLTKSRSPMALDIYQWLTHRVSYLRETTTIPWSALQLQFGGDYARVRKFRESFNQHLENVLKLYPQAKVESTPQGLLLRPSKTHIPMRLVRNAKNK